jgi:hypothetical protein
MRELFYASFSFILPRRRSNSKEKTGIFLKGRIVMDAKKLGLLVEGAVRLALEKGSGNSNGDLSVTIPLLAKALENENPLDLQTVLVEIAGEGEKH